MLDARQKKWENGAMRHKQTEFLEKDEIQSLYRTCDKTTLKGLRDFCIISLMVHTGLRRREVSALPRTAFLEQSRGLVLYARTKGDRSKKLPVRDLELIEAIAKYIRKTSDCGEPSGPLFWSIPKGRSKETHPISDETIRRVIERAVRLAKITKRITPHSLRHTFITQALHTGADIKTVQALAGHSNISTTSRYLHTTEERMEDAIKAFSFWEKKIVKHGARKNICEKISQKSRTLVELNRNERKIKVKSKQRASKQNLKTKSYPQGELAKEKKGV